MSQGKEGPFNPPSHGNHFKNFGDALEAALATTSPSEGPQNVTLQVIVSPNPGGVKEYIVNIGG
jgi:hypothetical protein